MEMEMLEHGASGALLGSGYTYLLILRANGRLVHDVSPELLAATGYQREELIGSQTAMILQPESGNLLSYPEGSGPYKQKAILIGKTASLAVMLDLHRISSNAEDITLCRLRFLQPPIDKWNTYSIQEWALAAYAEATRVIASEGSVSALLRGICNAVVSQSSYLLAWIGGTGDTPQDRLRVLAAAGVNAANANELYISVNAQDARGRGAIGNAIRTHEIQIIPDTHTSAAYHPWSRWADRNGIRSVIAIPFTMPDQSCAILAVYAPEPNSFNRMTIKVFSHLARKLEHGLKSLEQQEALKTERMLRISAENQVRDAYLATIQAMANALEARDSYTAGHQQRTKEIAEAIGTQMGFDSQQVQGLSLAASIHDIGKINIDLSILCKPGKLNNEEWLQIKQHVLTGHEIIRDIPFPWPIAEIVLQHHEREDGSGYPYGLKGEQILPEARVLIVADMLDAMASDRPYRRAIPLQIVLDELERESGRSLNSEAVAACLAVYRSKTSL